MSLRLAVSEQLRSQLRDYQEGPWPGQAELTGRPIASPSPVALGAEPESPGPALFSTKRRSEAPSANILQVLILLGYYYLNLCNSN